MHEKQRYSVVDSKIFLTMANGRTECIAGKNKSYRDTSVSVKHNSTWNNTYKSNTITIKTLKTLLKFLKLNWSDCYEH
ncbi:MAG: hypothetical protein GX154_06605 [Clostridiales bacterium]|nr:hypothetical protein [Clostridiales bacterium]